MLYVAKKDFDSAGITANAHNGAILLFFLGLDGCDDTHKEDSSTGSDFFAHYSLVVNCLQSKSSR
jgi:hypothetical protein